MNHDELVNVLEVINIASVSENSKDEAMATVLRLAVESFTKDILNSLIEAKNINDKNGNTLTTEKERRELRGGTAIVANGENIVRGGKPIASRYFDVTGSGEKISPLYIVKDFNGATGRT